MYLQASGFFAVSFTVNLFRRDRYRIRPQWPALTRSAGLYNQQIMFRAWIFNPSPPYRSLEKRIRFNVQEPWSEAQQERLELLRARVCELNRQLGALAAGWRHGPLSLHMNLALPSAPLSGTPAPNAAVLRSQNRMLTEVCGRLYFLF